MPRQGAASSWPGCGWFLSCQCFPCLRQRTGFCFSQKLAVKARELSASSISFFSGLNAERFFLRLCPSGSPLAQVARLLDFRSSIDPGCKARRAGGKGQRALVTLRVMEPKNSVAVLNHASGAGQSDALLGWQVGGGPATPGEDCGPPTARASVQARPS